MVTNSFDCCILVPNVCFLLIDCLAAQALQVMYSAMGSPRSLGGWNSSGGDPCGELWKGITCDGAAVVAMYALSGFWVGDQWDYGVLALQSIVFENNVRFLLALIEYVVVLYMLRNVTMELVEDVDLSNNNIHDSIPYQLPPNLTALNLAGNNISGSLPYSISNMVSLNYLNVSRNSLVQSVGDMFGNLQGLSTLDLSFNNFSSDLPSSLSSLSNLSTLHLQNNELTGSLNVLATLPLSDLNVANNHFSGWIPRELSSIPKFKYEGNSFDNGPAPPPPPYTPPPPGRSHNTHNRSGPHTDSTSGSQGRDSNLDHQDNKGVATGHVVGIVLGSILLVLCAMLVLVFCLRRSKGKHGTKHNARPLVTLPVVADKVASTEMEDQRVKSAVTTAELKPPPIETLVGDKVLGSNDSGRRARTPISAASYTVASLQTATNSFSQDYLIGEGSLGRVYRAEFPGEKVLAVKKIDSAAVPLQEEDDFMEAVSNMSRLRHPNIVSLVGYCAEYGQRLLVYEYIDGRTLHEVLHVAEESSKALAWNARVWVALATARALEYLHEVCLPPVVHRNFKSANILLDEDFNPHLSDSGMAALTRNTEREVSPQMIGSFGYSAPEFAMSGVYTVKSDVYSFGVVMLELLTGRKPLDSSRNRSEQSLVRWATPQLHDIDALAKMVDPALNGLYPVKSLSRFADVIALCVQPEPEFRPPMSEVVQALVRLMQRASTVRRRTSEESGFSYRTPENEPADFSL
ncbi:hypothetical protein Sjap_003042 [Stephania japonica]|uniref:Protein kinase domain-containing protein n=1 Tax=Stephania japonica TaxID=461633 RepID=A0AAP0KMZ4_9MAGN